MSLYKDASLVMIPSAYKDGKLYSIRPTDGDGDFTFSRGSNLAATRVDVNGLIEKGRENVLLQSNQFDTTWINNGTTETGGQTDRGGGSNAWLIEKSIAGGSIRQSIVYNGVGTFSIYAKAGSLDYILLYINYGSGTDTQAYFDLSSGSVGTTIAEIDATISSIGGGWYRCSVSFNTPSATATILVFPANGDNDTSGTSGSIYIQDAQLEQGLVATDYIETGASTAQAGILEDLPRLDYSGGASCPALLLEPQRSNVFPYSEYFSDEWSESNATLTHNAAISPEGVQNAASLDATALAASLRDNINVTGTYTFSVFVKGVNAAGIRLRVDAATDANSYFDLSDGSLVTSGGTNVTADSVDYGNGWRRYYMTADISNSQKIQLFITDGDTGYGLGEIYIYGAQFEAGSYPTSYIPTYGSAVTRSADSCLATSVSDLIGQTQGTLFAEIDFQQTESSSRFIAVGDGTSANRIAIFTNSSNDGLRVFVADNSNIQVDSSIAVSKGVVKLALAYDNNDYVLYVNGVSRITDTNASVPACDNVYLGRQEISLTNVLGSGIKQAVLFKTRLTNAELAALTA
jgi:hypothetical protein